MSLRLEKEVTGEQLEQRMELIKLLEDTEYEQYLVMKDLKTGEHYLHYRYIHRDVAAGGAEASYHQLMPIESDDVLGILFSGQSYRYPEAWKQPFLRNGPDGLYIWFDPAPALDADDSEREAARIREALLRFKQRESWNPSDIEKLLKEMDGDGE